ncbi:MAG: VPLPA-CTERM sorting domain-containing protein [Smithella sp.]
MKKSIQFLAVLMILWMGLAALAQAALVDRGGGLIYDTDLNVTWLQDANYANTTGYIAEGVHFDTQFPTYTGMLWSAAMTWAANLSYYDVVRGVTYSDWRLPKAYLPSSTNICFGGNCSESEIGHLWYTELGNTYMNGAQTSWNTGPFQHLQSWYWTQTPDPDIEPWAVWFRWSTGEQSSGVKEFYYNSVWAVRDGDVAAQSNTVPLPSALLLLGSGLAGLTGVRRFYK